MSFLLVRLYEFFLTVPRNGLLCSFFAEWKTSLDVSLKWSPAFPQNERLSREDCHSAKKLNGKESLRHA